MTDIPFEVAGASPAENVQNIRLEAAVSNMAQGLCMFDANQRLVICNHQYATLYQLPPELLHRGTPHDDIIVYRAAHGMQWTGGWEAFRRRNVARLAGREVGIETVVLKTGRVVEVRHQPMKDGGWVATHTDITDFKNQENALRVQNLRFDAAISNMSQGLCMFDRDRKLVVSNMRFAEIYKLPEALLTPGRSFDEILDYLRKRDGCDGAAGAYIRQHLELGEDGMPASVVVETPEGLVVSIRRRPISDGGWVSTHEDITEQRRNETHIRHLAEHDALTDLPNRFQFQNQIAEVNRRLDAGEKIAILCVDLDHFKSVNDTLGHSIGDEVLKTAAARLLKCCREVDIVARLGGDEFAVLQSSLNQREDAAVLARRIVTAVGEPIEILGHRIIIGASLGIAIGPTDGREAATLLRNADLALYRAKDEGRDTFHFYEEGMDTVLEKRLQMQMALKFALTRGELSLAFQPLVNLEHNTICAFEALLRWNHPTNGAIPPSEFVQVAEETGLIVPIGEWMLIEACRAAVTWPGEIAVTVNLSPVQFASPGLVCHVQAALTASGLPGARLELEVTEAALVADQNTSLKVLRQLREMGVKISIDDFGTGLSSLQYLRSFPLDKLKIGPPFINESLTNPDSMAIVKAVLSLGRSLGIATTAEGVESEAQLDFVRSEGATEGQGFLFSVPLPAKQIGKLLARFSKADPAGLAKVAETASLPHDAVAGKY